MNLAEITGLGLMHLLIPFLVVAISIDFASHRIPNLLTLIMLGCGFILQFALLGASGLLDAFGGMVVGAMILLPFYAIGAMGAGDVKLLGAAGSFLGPSGALMAGVLTLCVGGVLGIIVLVWKASRVWGRHLWLWPFLAAASNAAGSRFTYSPAIAVGTCIAAYQLSAPNIDSFVQSGFSIW